MGKERLEAFSDGVLAIIITNGIRNKSTTMALLRRLNQCCQFSLVTSSALFISGSTGIIITTCFNW